MKKVVVFTGAGISAESGIRTFRDSGGLWEEYRIEDVATPTAWMNNPEKVLGFYNQRRKQVLDALPNAAHRSLAELEKTMEVQIITQNIDDLHERAGSSRVLHLHGEIRKSRSTLVDELVYTIEGDELNLGETCSFGSQLRPHIVWFGEPVPAMEAAIALCLTADYFIVIGTSLEVYPAASLLEYVPALSKKYLIDPHAQLPYYASDFSISRKTAGEGVPEILNQIRAENV